MIEWYLIGVYQARITHKNWDGLISLQALTGCLIFLPFGLVCLDLTPDQFYRACRLDFLDKLYVIWVCLSATLFCQQQCWLQCHRLSKVKYAIWTTGFKSRYCRGWWGLGCHIVQTLYNIHGQTLFCMHVCCIELNVDILIDLWQFLAQYQTIADTRAG